MSLEASEVLAHKTVGMPDTTTNDAPLVFPTPDVSIPGLPSSDSASSFSPVSSATLPSAVPSSGWGAGTSIHDAIDAHRREIENQGLAQDVALKKWTLVILFLFLGFETVVVFLFAFFQGIQWYGFHLEEWSFRLLLTATISQITLMLMVAVRHLFPEALRQGTG